MLSAHRHPSPSSNGAKGSGGDDWSESLGHVVVGGGRQATRLESTSNQHTYILLHHPTTNQPKIIKSRWFRFSTVTHTMCLRLSQAVCSSRTYLLQVSVPIYYRHSGLTGPQNALKLNPKFVVNWYQVFTKRGERPPDDGGRVHCAAVVLLHTLVFTSSTQPAAAAAAAAAAAVHARPATRCHRMQSAAAAAAAAGYITAASLFISAHFHFCVRSSYCKSSSVSASYNVLHVEQCRSAVDGRHTSTGVAREKIHQTHRAC